MQEGQLHLLPTTSKTAENLVLRCISCERYSDKKTSPLSGGGSQALLKMGLYPFWCPRSLIHFSSARSKYSGLSSKREGTPALFSPFRCSILTLSSAIPRSSITSARSFDIPRLPKWARLWWNFSSADSGRNDSKVGRPWVLLGPAGISR